MYDKLLSDYKSRLEKYSIELESVSKHSTFISFLRLAVFIAGLILVYIASASYPVVFTSVLVVFIAVFLYLIKYHNKIIKKKKGLTELVKINHNEIKALEGDFSFFPNGKEYQDENHPFAMDLDLFGEGSFFQYVNRTCTSLGTEAFIESLLHPDKDKVRIEQKQKAINEISTDIDWIQKFQVTGNLFDDSIDDKQKILDWSKEKCLFFGKPGFTIARILFPGVNLGLLMLLIFGLVPSSLFLLSLVLTFGFLGLFLKRVNKIQADVGKQTELLSTYALLLKQFEDNNYESKLLCTIQEQLKTDGHTTNEKVKKLSEIAGALDTRTNMFAGILLNAMFVWDIQQVTRLERWKVKHQPELSKWFTNLALIDSLISLATFRYNHPDFAFPELFDEHFILKGKDLGHPLLFRDARICNDVNIEGWKQFQIITGANMAGKSTFLRTIGINLLLGMMGAPVCAKKFTFHPIELLTSLRTADSLFKNESYFYAELKRLKRIVDALEAGKKVFIILDEILKGTNSKDKQAGSIALVKQLITLNAVGIIATHDIALGELEKTYPGNIKNKCFEVDFKDDHLIFDYKLRDGISQNMNATFLMKKMGITV
jgi:DNA mismatch repair ATPase MutS